MTRSRKTSQHARARQECEISQNLVLKSRNTRGLVKSRRVVREFTLESGQADDIACAVLHGGGVGVTFDEQLLLLSVVKCVGRLVALIRAASLK